MVLLISLSLLWPISYAVLSSTNPCSGIIPHTHVLLRNTSTSALERHLNAEQSCHPQAVSSYGYHFSDFWSQPREVISVLEHDQGVATNLLNLIDALVVSHPFPSTVRVIGLSWLLLIAPIVAVSFAAAPPLPPPRAV